MNKSLVAIFITCAALSAPAHATLVSVNASDYAIGANTTHVSNAVDAVAIQAVRGTRVGVDRVPTLTYGDSFVTPLMVGTGTIDTGLRAFASPTLFTHFSPMAWASGAIAQHFLDGGLDFNPAEAIQFDFAQPTDYVQVFGGTTADGGSANEGMVAVAFDADWNFLGQCNGFGCPQELDPYVNGQIVTMSMEITTAMPVISHIIAGGQLQGFVSGITYRSTPEPATIALLTLGLLGSFMVRRSGKQAPIA